MFRNCTSSEDSPQVKFCIRCELDKNIVEFSRDGSRKDGFSTYCKECHREYVRRNREKISQKAREWQRSNPERVSGYGKVYRSRNREKAKQIHDRWRKSERGKKVRFQQNARRKSKYPEKIKANSAVNNAVALGTLPHISTQKCARCGSQAIEYHHHSYEPEFWLDVEPMCKRCHVSTWTIPNDE